VKPIGLLELDKLFTKPHDPVMYQGAGAIMPAGIRLRPLCHGQADFRVVYERPGGWLLLACTTCGMIVCRIAVARL